jgi:LacI family gluconate utilization system Gnt-I transcriptional repressor
MVRGQRKSGKPTLADVAEAAGVSPITVSRVMRNPASVSEPLRARVRHAVDEIGYVPNVAARQLASARTDVIAVIIPKISNAVFVDVLRGIYDAVAGTPFQIQLGMTEYSSLKEEALVRLFISQRPAAMLLTGSPHTSETVRMLSGKECPVIEIMELRPDPIDMQIGLLHSDAAHAATCHLIDQGYRRIGFLAAQMDPRTQQRLRGYIRAMQDAHLFDDRLIVTTTQPSCIAVGEMLLSELLARAVGADAAQANNDDVALGALFECQRRRIAIPRDFGLAGFNDLDMMASAHPTITSVVTHRYEMGRIAVEMLLAALSGARPALTSVDLGFELVPRQSTARRCAKAIGLAAPLAP